MSTLKNAMSKFSGLLKRTWPRRLALGASMCAALGAMIAGGLGVAQQATAIAEPGVVGGPALVRRLTEVQYRATVADIFAPDIPVVGRFERGLRVDGLLAIGTSRATISPFSVEQYDASARGIAAQVVSEERRAQLLPCQPADPARFDAACARRIIDHYGQLLFRRPLSGDERSRFVGAARDAQGELNDFYGAIQYTLAGMMDSPQFLLRIERTERDPDRRGEERLDAYSRATRLSYFLTNSTPDAELLRAAGAGELNNQEGLARQVDRLMSSPRYPQAVRAFFRDLLQFDLFDDISKDPQIYPAFNSNVARDAQEQTLRTIEHLLVTENGDYRDIFTTRSTSLTRSLGIVYRMPVATRNGWEEGEYGANSGRAGILTDVSFLALHSHPGRSSATLRGKAIRQIFLCQNVPDPPPNVDFSVVQDPSNTSMPTARVRLDAHRTQPTCAACHRLTDPMGLTLESFDGAGSFRTTENGAEIDVSGSLDGTNFESAVGLGQALHDHPQTARCLVQRMYGGAVGRTASTEERPYVDYLNQVFQESNYRVPALMRAIALSRNFYAISNPPPASGADHAEATRNGERS